MTIACARTSRGDQRTALYRKFHIDKTSGGNLEAAARLAGVVRILVGQIRKVPTVTGETLAAVVRRFRNHVDRHREALNRLNVYPVPDGDTGTNLALTASAMVTELQGQTALVDVCDAIAHGSLMGARGNSGVILSQVLRGLTDRLKHEETQNAAVMAQALIDGSVAGYSSVLRPQEGTMLTVIREAANGAEHTASMSDATLSDVLQTAYSEGEKALRNTPEQLPVLKEAGVVDAGGAGILLLLAAFLEEVADTSPSLPEDLLAAVPTATANLPKEPQFEVVFLLDADEEGVAELRRAFGSLGTSAVVVGGPTYKCHIHTTDIGSVIESAVRVGRPREISVTDLGDRPFEAVPGVLDAVAGVVAVVEGRGLVELFRQLGAQAVVRGGAGLNPSVAELLAGVDAARAETVVLLPNHKDVLPAAGRISGLTAKRVDVVGTRSVMEGLAAMIAYRPDDDPSQVVDKMTAAATEVATGQVARATRDTREYQSGDWISMVSDEVAGTAATVGEALVSLLERIVPSDAELVTIVVGLEGDDSATDAARTWMTESRPQSVMETIVGEQPVYAYYIAVE